jgi:hypothetical protein
MVRFSSLAMTLTAGTALVAQVTTGTLSGQVKDSKGSAIAGARVSIVSSAMMAPRVVTSDANGEWRAPLLPPGNYSVSVTKEGFVGQSAQGVRVGVGANARQDLLMKPVVAQAATVEVIASGQEVDKSDTKVGANFSAETLATLPAANRSFAGAADLAPGLTSGLGGSYSIRGGATQNTQYRVNGTDVKDDYEGNLTGTFVIEDNIEDTQVVLSPLNARNGRALGGAINVVTKSGSNNFAGSIRADIGRSTWGALNPSYLTKEGQVSDTLNKSYQVTLSGPIIKDRLWFAGGTILKPSQKNDYSLGFPYTATASRPVRTGNANIDGVLTAGNAAIPAGYTWTKFDENGAYHQVYDDKYYEGKLTGAITQDHTIEFSYSKSDVTLGPRNPFGDGGGTIGRLAALGTQTEKKQTYGWNYRGVLSSTMFLEARINKVDSDAVFPSGDPAYGTGEGMIIYGGNVTGGAGSRSGYSYPFGLGITPTPDRRNNRSGNLNFKMYVEAAGNHEFDFGFDYYESVRGTSRASGLKNQFFRAGGAFANTANAYLFPVIDYPTDATGAADYSAAAALGQSVLADGYGLRGLIPSLVQQTGKDGKTNNRNEALYANDQWTINSHWNVMLGLRYERMTVKDTDGSQIGNAKDFSPRVQVRYDLNGDSKHLFTVTGARYGGDFTTGFTDAFIKKADSKGVYYAWSGNGVAPGTATDPTYGVRFVDYAALTNANNYKTVLGYFDNSRTYVVDPNLKAPYMLEGTLSYRRGWDSGSYVKLTYVHRDWKKDWAFAQDYSLDQMVVIHDPTNTGQGDLGAQTIRVFNSSDLTRTYNGLEMEWMSKINPVWTMGGNWTISRLVGNNNGGDSNSGQSFRDNTPSGYYYNQNWLHNNPAGMNLSYDLFSPTGPLLQDQTHRARFYVSAVLPLGKGTVSYSAMLRYDSGTHYNISSNAPITGLASLDPNLYPSAPGTYTKFYGGRGQYSLNDSYQVDFKVNYQVPLGISRLMLIGDFSVNNLFNHIEAANLYSSFNSSPAGTNYQFLTNAASWGTTLPGTGRNFWNSGRAVGMSIGLRY